MIVKPKNKLDVATAKITWWVGSPSSIVLHTIFFVVMLALIFMGFNTDTILLVLTTIVSLEAIYLAIFIQYTVNQQGHKITEVVEDIGEVTEDVGEITKDVEEISKEVEDISGDVDEISKDIDEIQAEAEKDNLSDAKTYARIEQQISTLLGEVNALKARKRASGNGKTKETAKLKKLGQGLKTISKKLKRKK